MRKVCAMLSVLLALTANAVEESKLAVVRGILTDTVPQKEAVYRSELKHLLRENGEHLLYHDGTKLSVINKADGNCLWSVMYSLPWRGKAVFHQDRVYAICRADDKSGRELRIYDRMTGQKIDPPIPMNGLEEGFVLYSSGSHLFVSNGFPWEMQVSGTFFRVDPETGKPQASTSLKDRLRHIYSLSTTQLVLGSEVFDAQSLESILKINPSAFPTETTPVWVAHNDEALYGTLDGLKQFNVVAVSLKNGLSLWKSKLPQRPEEARGVAWEDSVHAAKIGEMLVFVRSWGVAGIHAATGEVLWEQHLPLVSAGFGSGGPFYSEAKNKGVLTEYIGAEFKDLQPRHFPETQFKITVPHPYDFRLAVEPFQIGKSAYLLINYRNVMPHLFPNFRFGRVEKDLDWTKRNWIWKTKEGEDSESIDRIVLLKFNPLTGHPLEHQTIATGKQAGGLLVSKEGRTIFIATMGGGLLRVDVK